VDAEPPAEPPAIPPAEPPAEPPAIPRAELRAELARRVAKDQAARRSLDGAAMKAADEENLPWLKQVVADVGWPGTSLVGAAGAHDAWLLVQHADGDPAFQRQCLELLTAAAGHGEASWREVAYLTDRVLLAEGKPQEFGTQATARDGKYVARKLRDPAGVNDRRTLMGLGPLAPYLDQLNKLHGPPEPATVACHACGTAIEFWLPDDGNTLTLTCPSCGEQVTVTVTFRP